MGRGEITVPGHDKITAHMNSLEVRLHEQYVHKTLQTFYHAWVRGFRKSYPSLRDYGQLKLMDAEGGGIVFLHIVGIDKLRMFL